MITQIMVSFIMLILGILGIWTNSNLPVSIFLIVVSLLSFLAILIEYTEKKKS